VEEHFNLHKNPADFDGITGANIAKQQDMQLQQVYIKDGARVTQIMQVANFFHFTVDTDTATIGNVKGGGYGCSVGPVHYRSMIKKIKNWIKNIRFKPNVQRNGST
jgi:hypothetical protein